MYKLLSFCMIVLLTVCSFADFVVWDKNTQKFYLCNDFNNPQAGVVITESGTYNGIDFSVIGVTGDRSISIENANVSNYFRVRWYMLDGELYRNYQWVSIGDTTSIAVYQRGQTYFYSDPDAGWQPGYIGFVLEVIPPSPPTWTLDFQTQSQD